MNAPKQLGIIIVTCQNERHIAPLLASLAATIDRASSVIWIWDNASTDGTLAAIERESAVLGLPLRLVKHSENIGFAPANNRAYAELIRDTPCENVILLNPDTVVHPGWWQPLIEALKDPSIGTASSLLLLPDGTINSRGNALHFLGFGFVRGYGQSENSAAPESQPMFSGSGAAVAFRPVRLDELNAKLGTTGIFWDDLFLYAEDADLGWRMRMAGFDNRLVPASRVTHDHRFWLKPLDAGGDRLLLIERNRYLVLLSNFKWATIILLLPWIAASEIALALGLQKLYRRRLKLWREVTSHARASGLRQRRRRLQTGRTVSDRTIFRTMTGSIHHGAIPFRPVDRWLDSILRLSHRLLCLLIWW